MKKTAQREAAIYNAVRRAAHAIGLAKLKALPFFGSKQSDGIEVKKAA